MEGGLRTELVARLAERGLALESFDGHVLTVRYNPNADSDSDARQGADIEAISRYLRYVITDVPGSDQLFPGLQSIEIERVDRRLA